MKDELYLDELTGTYNRRYLNEHIREQVASFIIKKTPVSVVMVDIDHFKDINDVHGHLKGDEVIIEFARFLRKSLRASDVVIRYGGDEFTCMMPEVAKYNAQAIHQRIARQCKERTFSDLTITLSAGVASFPEDGSTFDDLLNRADQALYDAKRSGRDRVGIIGEKRAEFPIKAFIDRLEEKEHIARTLSDHEDRVRVTLVRGVIGVGKTRLSKEVLGDLKGKEVIWGDCIYFEKPLAYYAIRELIKYRVKRRGLTIFEEIPFVYQLELGKLIPDILDTIKDQIDPVAMVVDRYRLYESVRRVLEAGARNKVIIIDNIQWIDDESIEVLKYLLRAFRDTSVTFFFIQRTEEATETLDAFISSISHEFDMLDIVLEPFQRSEILQAIQAIIGDTPPQDLVEYITRASGGIPFYIEEIMRALIDQRRLYIEKDAWRFTRPESDIVPRNLADIAIKKYRVLTKEAQYVLEIASAMGSFDLPVLQQITEFNEGHVLGLMNEIARVGIVKNVQDSYEFSAAISRHAIYNNFVKGFKARALHCTIASIIEARSRGKEDEVVDDLALHYYLAQDREKGTVYCVAAGDRARDKYAHRDAIRYYSWASDLLEQDTDPRSLTKRIECDLKKVMVLTFIGSTNAAMEIINKTLELTTEHEDDRLRADILHQKTRILLETAQFEQTIATGAQATALYDKTGSTKNKAHVLCLTGRAQRRMGRLDSAMSMFEEALRLFDAAGAEDEKANALINIGNVLQNLGDYARALENFETCLAIHRKLSDRDGEARILTNISNVYSRTGRIDDALANVRKAAAIFNELGDRVNEARALNNIATILDTLGEYEEGLPLYQQALEIHRDVGNRDGEVLVLVNIGSVHWHFDDQEKARTTLEQALQIATDINSELGRFWALLNLTDIYMNSGEYEKTESFLEQIFTVAGDNKHQLKYALQIACDYYLKRGDRDRFATAIARFKKVADDLQVPEARALYLHIMGRHHLDIGELEQAARLLKEAQQLFEKIKDNQMNAITNYYLSKAEQARGNTDIAREYFSKAHQQLSAISAQRWLNTIGKDIIT